MDGLIGKLIGPLLVTLDVDGKGIAIINGVSLRVEWSGKSEQRWIGAEGRRIGLSLDVIDVLDEKQQVEKIARLENQLAEERERLDGMRQIFDGTAYAASTD